MVRSLEYIGSFLKSKVELQFKPKYSSFQKLNIVSVQ
nr:MAG TPA: hypothetical protein [Caudoviricetes sp.]